MTTEELLKPRYKVIADYPCRPHPIGYILEFSGDKYDTQSLFRLPNSDHRYPEDKFKEYPNLFEPLPWWKDRKAEDMPEYIMFAKDYANFKKGQVFKTENWNKQHESVGFCIGFITGTGKYDKRAVPASCGLQPATLDDYSA